MLRVFSALMPMPRRCFRFADAARCHAAIFAADVTRCRALLMLSLPLLRAAAAFAPMMLRHADFIFAIFAPCAAADAADAAFSRCFRAIFADDAFLRAALFSPLPISLSSLLIFITLLAATFARRCYAPFIFIDFASMLLLMLSPALTALPARYAHDIDFASR